MSDSTDLLTPPGVSQGDNLVIARVQRRDRTNEPELGTAHKASILKPPAAVARRLGVDPRALSAHMRTNGIPAQRMSASRVAQITEDLLTTPIHGHRRGGSKNNHRSNPEHIRR